MHQGYHFTMDDQKGILETVMDYDDTPLRLDTMEVLFEQPFVAACMQTRVDASTQTDILGPSIERFLGAKGFIFINRPLVNPNTVYGCIRAYRHEACNQLRGINNVHGRFLVAERADSLIVFARGLLYLNRPYMYVTDRWPHKRVFIRDIMQLMDFFHDCRSHIMDFYKACLCINGATPYLCGKAQPEALINIKCYKNVTKPWIDQLVFDL